MTDESFTTFCVTTGADFALLWSDVEKTVAVKYSTDIVLQREQKKRIFETLLCKVLTSSYATGTVALTLEDMEQCFEKIHKQFTQGPRNPTSPTPQRSTSDSRPRDAPNTTGSNLLMHVESSTQQQLTSTVGHVPNVVPSRTVDSQTLPMCRDVGISCGGEGDGIPHDVVTQRSVTGDDRRGSNNVPPPRFKLRDTSPSRQPLQPPSSRPRSPTAMNRITNMERATPTRVSPPARRPPSPSPQVGGQVTVVRSTPPRFGGRNNTPGSSQGLYGIGGGGGYNSSTPSRQNSPPRPASHRRASPRQAQNIQRGRARE